MAKKDDVYEFLKESIVSGTLLPEQPISELAISNELQMSRTPVREALLELEKEGLIVSYPSRGSFVAPLTSDDVKELYSLRILLESWALERAFDRIALEEINDLEGMLLKSRSTDGWMDRHEADRKLHALIVDKAGSKRLKNFLNIINLQNERVRRLNAKDNTRANASLEEHLEIIECIRNRDKEGSISALKKHLESGERTALQLVEFGFR